ncbi:DUF805 domain-containing protein [Tepidibacter sp. Z1-5]|uniref:DUF805 domain-containing protein n=1 Tax=Tepidibacter sp. Z1-5 TaxID=3134138 RepID=UPI004040A2D7
MKNLFNFNGRMNRFKYFGYQLLFLTIHFILNINSFSFTENFSYNNILFPLPLPYAIIFIYLTIQRLHDINRPKLHIFLLLIPIYNIYLSFLLYFKKGSYGFNKYGEDPLLL